MKFLFKNIIIIFILCFSSWEANAKDIRLVVLDFEGAYAYYFDTEYFDSKTEKVSDVSKNWTKKYQVKLNQSLSDWSYKKYRTQFINHVKSVTPIKQVHIFPVNKNKMYVPAGHPDLIHDLSGYKEFYWNMIYHYPFYWDFSFNLNGINDFGFKRFDDLKKQGAEGILELRILNKFHGIPHKKEEKVKARIITLAQLTYIDLVKDKIKWHKIVYDKKDKVKNIEDFFENKSKHIREVGSKNIETLLNELFEKSKKKLEKI